MELKREHVRVYGITMSVLVAVVCLIASVAMGWCLIGIVSTKLASVAGQQRVMYFIGFTVLLILYNILNIIVGSSVLDLLKLTILNRNLVEVDITHDVVQHN